MNKIYSQDILGDIDFPFEENDDFFALKKERKKTKKKLQKAYKKGKNKKIKKLIKKVKALDKQYKALINTLTSSGSNKSSVDWGKLINECAPKIFEILAENYHSKRKYRSDDDDDKPTQFFTTKK